MSSAKLRLEVTALNYWIYTYIRKLKAHFPYICICSICSTIRAVPGITSAGIDPLFSTCGVCISFWSLACNPALNCLISFCRNKWNLMLGNKTTQIFIRLCWCIVNTYISSSLVVNVFLKPQRWMGLKRWRQRWKWSLMFDNPVI